MLTHLSLGRGTRYLGRNEFDHLGLGDWRGSELVVQGVSQRRSAAVRAASVAFWKKTFLIEFDLLSSIGCLLRQVFFSRFV
jgi:hypothetical protein